jgi:hypothetical protein
LLTCNQTEHASLPPGQIVPALADQGIYNSSGEDCVYGSESSFYRVLHAHGQVHRRGGARPPQEPRPVPRLRAASPNEVWSWDIERHEAPWERAVMKGHCHRPVAAGR